MTIPRFVFKDHAVAAKDGMAGQLEIMKVKYEEAVEMRKKAELDIEAFRPVCFLFFTYSYIVLYSEKKSVTLFSNVYVYFI